MKLFLAGHTAIDYWEYALSRGPLDACVDFRSIPGNVPSRDAIRYLERTLPRVRPPFDLLVASELERRVLSKARVSVSGYPYPKGSFVRIASGLYASSPELCFIQTARSCGVVEAAMVGSCLCGSFAKARSSFGGEGHGAEDVRGTGRMDYGESGAMSPLSRDAQGGDRGEGLIERPPLTNTAMMGRYLKGNPGLFGAKRALLALPYVLDGAASPPEVHAAMALSLPSRLGGFGLPAPKLNMRIDHGKRLAGLSRKRYHVADLCWPEWRVVVEYNSRDRHDNDSQMLEDSVKQGLLEEMGFRVIAVTPRMLRDPQEMRRVAERVARRGHYRLTTRSKNFDSAQKALFDLFRKTR